MSFVQDIQAQENSSSTIVIYRENRFAGSAWSHKIYIRDSLVVILKNNSFYQYNYFHGDYIFTLKRGNSPLKLSARAGKTYYIHFNFRSYPSFGLQNLIPEILLGDSVYAHFAMKNGTMKAIR